MRLFELWENPYLLLETKLDTSKEEVYLWCYHPEIGLNIAKGRYAQHSTIFGDTVFQSAKEDFGIIYDDFDRGYIKTFPQIKALYFMPTDPRERYDFDMNSIFKREFPNWNIIKMNGCNLNIEPSMVVRDAIKDAIRSLLNSFSNDTPNMIGVDIGKTLQPLIKKELSSQYIVSKVILRSAKELRVSSSKEKYLVMLPPSVDYWTDNIDFKIQPVVTKERAVKV